MSKIEFISINKPDFKKAAELLGPILYEMLKNKRLAEHNKSLCCKLKEPDQFDSGDSVA